MQKFLLHYVPLVDKSALNDKCWRLHVFNKENYFSFYASTHNVALLLLVYENDSYVRILLASLSAVVHVFSPREITGKNDMLTPL